MEKEERPAHAAALESLAEGIKAFSKKHSCDPSLLAYVTEFALLDSLTSTPTTPTPKPPESLEIQILRAALKAIELQLPHPELQSPLRFDHIFPHTPDPSVEQNRAHLFLTTLKESIPPTVQEQACTLAEPNITIATAELVNLSNQIGEALNDTPNLKPLLDNALPAPLWAEASWENPIQASHLDMPIEIVGVAGSRNGVKYLRTRTGAIVDSTEVKPPLPQTAPNVNPHTPTESIPTEPNPNRTDSPTPQDPPKPVRQTTPPPHELKIQRLIESWYRSQLGVEIEDLPLDKKLDLQGIPSPEDITKPDKKNRLAKAAKVAGFIACWAIWPPCAVVLIGAILTQKYLIKQNRNPQTREKKFRKEYGPQFHPEKEPWNRQIASEILSAGVDLHTKLGNEGEATQKLVILGSCTEHEKSWACEERALRSLSEKGYSVLSLETPRDLPPAAIQEIKTFRELTENCPPKLLLPEAKKFLGDFAHEEWALTLARTSLANQLNLTVAFNGPPTKKQVDLQESFQKLADDLALQSKETARDIISNLHGGPMAAANLEMARREVTLEKTKDTVRNLLDYSENKTIHLCCGRNSFALQEAWAHLTQKRPLALQIAPPQTRYPWNPWGVDNPAASKNAIPITAETVRGQLGPSHKSIPLEAEEKTLKKIAPPSRGPT